MFERFTLPARQVLVYAQDEARSMGHDYIGGEHILLGLLSERDGLAARVLGSQGIALESARTEVARAAGRQEPPTTGQIPFTPNAVAALGRCVEEADAMNHGFVGTEHVLLGLLAVRDEAVENVLVTLGSSSDRIRVRVMEMLSGAA